MRSFKVLSASCILVGFICFFLVMQKEKNQEYKDYKTNKDPEIFQDKSFLHKLSLLIYDVLTSQGGWQVWFLAHWRTIPINTYCPSIACPFFGTLKMITLFLLLYLWWHKLSLLIYWKSMIHLMGRWNSSSYFLVCLNSLDSVLFQLLPLFLLCKLWPFHKRCCCRRNELWRQHWPILHRKNPKKSWWSKEEHRSCLEKLSL